MKKTQEQLRRETAWQRAGEAVEAAGSPMTTAVTITWSTCLAADRTPGNILGLPENERVNRVWDRMRRLAREFGEDQWIAARAPEYDRQKAHHVHIGARIPAAADFRLIKTIERLTGAPAERIYSSPTTVRLPGGRVCHGVIAIGQLGAWLIQKNTRIRDGGTAGLMKYVSKAPRTRQTSAQYRLSCDMLRISREYDGGTITPEQARRARGDCHRRASQVSGYPEARNASRPSTAFLRPLEAHQGAAWAR